MKVGVRDEEQNQSGPAFATNVLTEVGEKVFDLGATGQVATKNRSPGPLL